MTLAMVMSHDTTFARSFNIIQTRNMVSKFGLILYIIFKVHPCFYL